MIFSTTILRGLPVEVEAHIYPSEPDIGIFHPWAEVEAIYWPPPPTKPGRRPKPLRQISDKVLARLNDADWEKLADEALEARP